jgi:hypothetical protein
VDLRIKKRRDGILKKALDKLGAEALDGSGFETETPEPEFSDREPVAPESLN